ncbi:MAG: L-rhamnose isomerase [Faecalicatena sp.]|uniref:L-rhamnose isomerase n=1 Tax=Faecalicatena sp. TaxID=2005360 RepID=UPI002590AEF0|nr:L-rhamnose isomerase [Faecalicatena sp.]MCI6466963.1 L-rhamnose isomerase [Faecalicatena sp.]MDY5617671.1 L-rhamnose isomerase [Lachnospiraceae bacterium]
MSQRYIEAREKYGNIGVDTEQAIEKLQRMEIAMHCWQGDDLGGFDFDGPLSGGIQATGNYPGKARNAEELMRDIDQAFSLIPGSKRLNLHASYAIFEDGKWVDRDCLRPEHFRKWVEFAKERKIGIDFNPTFFSHPKAKQFTLSSTEEEIRKFWIRHGQACIRIAEYFAEELGKPCLVNIWIPDGYKDIPADRLGPRMRLKESLDEILSMDYHKEKVFVSLESKVFGIGLESYTVCSSEFCINYAAEKGILALMDNGHYHPTETVSDKISAMLPFHERMALHITRPVRWDSDHVVLFDDETKEIAKEIVRNDALERMFLSLDFFDASINRVAAWIVGMRSVQKAFLYAMLQPNEALKGLQEKEDFTKLMVWQEEQKFYPFMDVWEEFCVRNQVPAGEEWLSVVEQYEKAVQSSRSAEL